MEMKDLDSSKIKILVCCHKPCDLPKDDIFLPIQVGSAISNVDLGIQRDDQLNGQPCDNISSKNQSYCELTAVYWAWKNIKKLYPDLEYIGLNHYRRFFDFDHPNAYRGLFVQKESEVANITVNYNKLSSLLQRYDGIIAKKKQYQYPLYIDYSICHISDDLRTLRSVIYEKQSEYTDAFNKVFMRNGALSHFNMCVMNWDAFDAYCTWLFSVLSEVEQRIDISNYNANQKRIFGYLAERLWNIYILKNKMKIKEVPIVWYVNDKKQDSVLRSFLLRVWGKISVALLIAPEGKGSAKRFN